MKKVDGLPENIPGEEAEKCAKHVLANTRQTLIEYLRLRTGKATALRQVTFCRT